MKVADPKNLPTAGPSEAATATGRRRVGRRAVAAVVLGAVLFSACASDPGPSRVARDIIQAESVRNPDLDEECLLRELDRYTDEDLRAIDQDLASSDPQRNEDGEAALLAYQRSLEVCR